MEMREFAERVLFAATLEEKLAAPGDLTDEARGPAIATPASPGRPADLGMRRGGRAAFPGPHRLMDEEQRGLLLHFFANHELLATELMALVLLKFPDAPASFRRGIVRTLHEEQRHTRWYLERMGECGVRFGDFHLNRFFWDAIAPMETPLDYVARLSLTFEQANLDYARHYARVLRSAGDGRSAAILEQIYRDEIGHVGYGLKWFRRWKDPHQREWEAYRAALRFPLSPSRGKGNAPFNAEGRLRAGLPKDFVCEMEVFSQSKGRTPNVFWFNPHAESAMAAELQGRPFQPRAAARDLALDLEILPAFLCRRDDVLLMTHPPDRVERARLQGLGFVLPQFEPLESPGRLATDSPLRNRKLNDLRPWAWGPDSAELLAPLAANLPGDPRPIQALWNAGRRSVFSKVMAVELRRELHSSLPEAAAERDTLGTACTSVDALSLEIDRLRKAGVGAVVMKAPYGAAGQKNRRLLPHEPLARAVLRWAERLMESQGALVVEPWLDRVFDFSVQFEMREAGLRQIALTHLFNDARGQFVACACGAKFGTGIPTEVARFLLGGAEPLLRLYEHVLAGPLGSILAKAGCTGPVGVDAFVYRTNTGALRLQPLVEVNPRFTMGRLAVELLRQVAPGRRLRLELANVSAARATGASSLAEYAARPAAPVLDASGRLCGGSAILNDARIARRVLAVLRVE